MAINTAPDKSAETTAVSFYRLSVRQYHEMAARGILAEDEPVELLEGLLVKKMTKNPRRITANGLLDDWLRLVNLSGWFVNVQQSLAIEDSEPEPDISLVRGKRLDYNQKHVTPADVALVAEISDSSLQIDRKLKLRLYAQARIPVYWIVNLINNRLEIYSDPFGDGDAATYRQHTDYQPTDEAPVVIDGQEVARFPLRDLFA